MLSTSLPIYYTLLHLIRYTNKQFDVKSNSIFIGTLARATDRNMMGARGGLLKFVCVDDSVLGDNLLLRWISCEISWDNINILTIML